MRFGRRSIITKSCAALAGWLRLHKQYYCYAATHEVAPRVCPVARDDRVAPDLRRRLHLDQPDAQVRLVERDDGRVELVPVVAIPADQAWFWTDRWQTMEREADADIAAGRVTAVDGIDELVALLDADPPER